MIVMKMNGGNHMSNITQLELQNLRHLIGAHDTTHCKLTAYAAAAMDEQVKQYFTKSAQCAMDTKQKLMGFLN
jgi:hypothetical protein